MELKMESSPRRQRSSREGPDSNNSSNSSRSRSKMKGITKFTSYFREKHRREEEKKEEERRESAEKLKAILRPVRFSEEEEERLAQLKEYKRLKQIIQKEKSERFRKSPRDRLMPCIPEKRIVTPPPVVGDHLRIRSLGSPNTCSPRISHPLPRPITTTEGNFTKRSLGVLHQHTWEERVSIILTLMVLLFISLHADAFGERILPSIFFQDNKLVPWWVLVLKDWGRFCHMSACSLIHFAVCDVSLIYAFESIELGTKSGPKVKEFYREKVHLVVAAFSGGIVALSICKALLMAWFRTIRDLVEMVFTLGRDSFTASLSFLQYLWSYPAALINAIYKSWLFVRCMAIFLWGIPTALVSFIQISWFLFKCAVAALKSTSPSKWITSACSALARVMTGICIWILAILIPFDHEERPRMVPSAMMLDDDNSMECVEHVSPETDALLESNTTLSESIQLSVNGTLNATIVTLVNTTFNVTTDAAEILNISVADVPVFPSKEVTYWRNDAFETCRYLLSYSAVFLVAFLVSLNFLMRSFRHTDTSSTRDIDTSDISIAHSSIQTTPSLAHDESHRFDTMNLNVSRDASIETASTAVATRPTSITVTIASSNGS